MSFETQLDMSPLRYWWTVLSAEIKEAGPSEPSAHVYRNHRVPMSWLLWPWNHCFDGQWIQGSSLFSLSVGRRVLLRSCLSAFETHLILSFYLRTPLLDFFFFFFFSYCCHVCAVSIAGGCVCFLWWCLKWVSSQICLRFQSHKALTLTWVGTQ